MEKTIISKTTFLEYLYCPKNTWLKLYKPELLEEFTLSDYELYLLEQGNEVEECARSLFPGGALIDLSGDEACQETARHISQQTSVIFQAAFLKDGFLAKIDVLAWNEAGKCWDVYEVKGTNSLKEDSKDRDHVSDLTFQVSVLRRAGVPLGKHHIIHLNKEYTRFGNLDIYKLFEVEDITDKVVEKLSEIEGLMGQAMKDLSSKEEPKGGCECFYESRRNHCTTFSYSHPHIPDYGIHDLVRIGNSKKKLVLMVENEWYRLDDIPEDFELSPNQRNQVNAHRTGRPIIDETKIREELGSLAFPLYFLDYETFAPAIPIFDGYRPYQRIPFQFSLHILQTPNGELEQVEFLQTSCDDPSEKVARHLEEHINPRGTVIVWFEPFEKGVNKEIGERIPEFRPIMERINGQVYDLMGIFAKQHYVQPGFRGSVSIKKVLPVIAPELTYSDLEIKEGTKASESWWEMVSPDMSIEKNRKSNQHSRPIVAETPMPWL